MELADFFWLPGMLEEFEDAATSSLGKDAATKFSQSCMLKVQASGSLYSYAGLTEMMYARALARNSCLSGLRVKQLFGFARPML